MNIDTDVKKVKVTCTDNGNSVEAVVDRFREHDFIDVIMANTKVRLKYNSQYGKAYVGSAVGLEFTVPGPVIQFID
jgi:hypothetical protein